MGVLLFGTGVAGPVSIKKIKFKLKIIPKLQIKKKKINFRGFFILQGEFRKNLFIKK